MDNNLPFSYSDPLNMFLYWICDRDENGDIMSIFVNEEKERDVYSMKLNSMEDAISQRDALLAEHWQKIFYPKIEIKVDEDVSKMKGKLRKKLQKQKEAAGYG